MVTDAFVTSVPPFISITVPFSPSEHHDRTRSLFMTTSSPVLLLPPSTVSSPFAVRRASYCMSR
jgi:hypothetical protein